MRRPWRAKRSRVANLGGRLSGPDTPQLGVPCARLSIATWRPHTPKAALSYLRRLQPKVAGRQGIGHRGPFKGNVHPGAARPHTDHHCDVEQLPAVTHRPVQVRLTNASTMLAVMRSKQGQPKPPAPRCQTRSSATVPLCSASCHLQRGENANPPPAKRLPDQVHSTAADPPQGDVAVTNVCRNPAIESCSRQVMPKTLRSSTANWS